MAVGSQSSEIRSSSFELPHLVLLRGNAYLKIFSFYSTDERMNPLASLSRTYAKLLNPPPNLRKRTFPVLFEVHSVTLLGYPPFSASEKTNILNFVLIIYFLFLLTIYISIWHGFYFVLFWTLHQWNRTMFLVTWFLFSTMLNDSLYLQFIHFYCCVLLYTIYLFDLMSVGIWVVSHFLLFGTMLLWKGLNSCLLIVMCSVIVFLVFLPSSGSVGLYNIYTFNLTRYQCQTAFQSVYTNSCFQLQSVYKSSCCTKSSPIFSTV